MRMLSDPSRVATRRPSAPEAGLALLLLLGGCHRSEPTARVTGSVTVDGRVPTAAMVLAENRERGILATATIDVDGRYELRTGRGRGLPGGEYRMAVVPRPGHAGDIADQMQTRFLQPGEKPPSMPAPLGDVPKRYHSTDTSGLAVTVAPPETRFDIVIERGAGDAPRP